MIKEKSEIKIDKLLLYSLMTVVFFPLFPPIFGNTSVHIIPIALLASLGIIFRKRRWFILRKEIIEVKIFFGITFLLLTISLLCDSMSISETNFSDFLGVLKPIYFYIFFIAGFSNVIDDYRIVKTLCVFFEIAIVLSFIIAVSEVFFIDMFKTILYNLFKRQERVVLLDKATGWFGVTYYFAYFILLLCFYSFFKFVEKLNLKYSLLFLCSFITLFLTQSRTVILALISGFLLIPFLKLSYVNKKIYVVYFLFVCILLGVIFNSIDLLKDKLGYAFIGIQRLFTEGVNIEGGGSGSANIRVNQVWWAWSNNDLKLIGGGLARKIQLESVYAAYLYRLGLFYLSFFIYLLFYFYKISRNLAIYYKKNKLFYAFFSALSVFYLTSPISLFASASHEMPKLAFLFFICSAVVYRFNIKYKKYEQNKYNYTSL
ncbi:hypothetical protein [Tenacibaculum ascidiaceicola]|uniref:hypothetical protein n=1 Tax=Tenacibaculum ascidiaceicola TaxID=1699411 RepID=UPI003CE516F6